MIPLPPTHNARHTYLSIPSHFSIHLLPSSLFHTVLLCPRRRVSWDISCGAISFTFHVLSSYFSLLTHSSFHLGGFSHVFLAADVNTGYVYALKRMFANDRGFVLIRAECCSFSFLSFQCLSVLKRKSVVWLSCLDDLFVLFPQSPSPPFFLDLLILMTFSCPVFQSDALADIKKEIEFMV